MKKTLLEIAVLAIGLSISADLFAQESRSNSRRTSIPRPFLYAYPEKPGESPLAEVRKSMLEQFDADKDGFLNKAERNAMRLATKKFSDERHDEIRRARERRGGGREGAPRNRRNAGWQPMTKTKTDASTETSGTPPAAPRSKMSPPVMTPTKMVKSMTTKSSASSKI